MKSQKNQQNPKLLIRSDMANSGVSHYETGCYLRNVAESLNTIRYDLSQTEITSPLEPYAGRNFPESVLAKWPLNPALRSDIQ
jgi:hypothetical protein